MIISALFGAVRLRDRIPPYRLDMCGRLPDLAHLPQLWRGPLDEVLPVAARRGLVVDCRSAEYGAAWRPSGSARVPAGLPAASSTGKRARSARSSTR